MAHSGLAAALFVSLLAGNEAARITHVDISSLEVHSVASQHQEALAKAAALRSHVVASKTPDLDWPGCGKASWFCSTEGCKRQYLWLDTPRQSCRFTDAYKLTHDQKNFLQVELARLEEKSEIFARTGCLFTGQYWFDRETYAWKCVRRTHQMIRLSRYVSKAMKEAKEDAANPAHEFATSEEAAKSLKQIGDNMAAGFDKYEASAGTGLKVGEAWKNLVEVMKQREAAGQKPTVEQEAANITAAMLELVDVENTPKLRADLGPQLAKQAAFASKDVEMALDGLAEATMDHDLVGVKDTDAAVELDEEQTEALSDTGVPEENGTALVQLHDGASSSLAAQGTGPLKWIWKNVGGWIVSRIAWLLLFVLGLALGIIAVGAPAILSFLGCTLFRVVKWFVGDVIYNAGWEGEYGAVAKGLHRVGQCAPEVEKYFGLTEGAATVVLKPARFASHVTGVRHLYDDNYYCSRCPENSECRSSICYCKEGFYPAKGAPSCVQAETRYGCACKVLWYTENWLSTSVHHGCSGSECEVDTEHSSFASCKAAVEAAHKAEQDAAWVWSSAGPLKDECYSFKQKAEVPPLADPRTRLNSKRAAQDSPAPDTETAVLGNTAPKTTTQDPGAVEANFWR